MTATGELALAVALAHVKSEGVYFFRVGLERFGFCKYC